MLARHVSREEVGIFAALEEQGDFADSVRELEAEHVDFDRQLARLDDSTPDFAAVLRRQAAADLVCDLEQGEVLVHQLGDGLHAPASTVFAHTDKVSANDACTAGPNGPPTGPEVPTRSGRRGCPAQLPIRSQPRRGRWLPSSASSRLR
jgi:hypothetical protein